MPFNRRKFLRLSCGGMLASNIPMPVFSKADSDYLSNVIAQIKKAKFSTRELRLLYPKGSLGNLQPVVDAFSASSGMTVQLTEASLDNIASQLILSQKLGTQPYDVILPPTFAIPDLVEADAIIDLTDMAQEYEPEELFTEALYRKGDFHKERLYGYQADGDVYLMFYNMSFLEHDQAQRYEDHFGQAFQTPMTWQELDQQMIFFNEPQQQRFGGNLYRNRNYIAWEFWLRMHAKGRLPMADDMTPMINSTQAKEALEDMIRCQNCLPPDIYKQGLFENFKSFAEGNKFCNIGWGGTQKYLQDNNSPIKDSLKFSPALGGEIHGQRFLLPFFNWGWNYVVGKQTQDPLAAYLFCLFASTPEISTASVSQADGYFDPHRSEHFESEDITQVYGNDFLVAQKNSLLNCIPDFYLRGQGRYLNALKEAVYTACLKQVSVEYALNKVAEKWQGITLELGLNEQQLQWRYLRELYPDDFLARVDIE